LIENSVSSYLEAAASRSPAPGGGSVTALTGALGAAMVSMAANFTVGKKKYEDVQDEVNSILSESEKLRLRLAKLVDEDIEAYSAVSSAYSLPKGTDSEKKIRAERIMKATKEAVAVPLEVARCCFRVLELCRRLVDIGNRNLISDVGVAVLLAEAALRGADVNVEINLVSLSDASFVEEKRSVMKPYLEESGEILKEVVTKVTNVIH
jgi:glutamate formiminotransferase/formiminotetrahydrofolate cyclodeaminase